MALTPSTVTRTDDSSGDLFLTFTTPGGSRAQGVALVDSNGNPIGFTGSPAVVSVSGDVSIDDSTPVDVAVTGTVDVDDSTPINVAVAGALSPVPVFGAIPTGSTAFRYSTGTTAEASAVIQGTSCLLRQIRVILDPTITVARYLMLFDATSLPADGAAPVWRAYIPARGQMSESWDADGLSFGTNGLVAAISTRADQLEVAASGEAYFHATGWT